MNNIKEEIFKNKSIQILFLEVEEFEKGDFVLSGNNIYEILECNQFSSNIFVTNEFSFRSGVTIKDKETVFIIGILYHVLRFPKKTKMRKIKEPKCIRKIHIIGEQVSG